MYLLDFEEFGEKRADQYFKAFFERFELSAEKPKMYPAADEVAKGLGKSLCGRDTIYYEIVETGIIIQLVLGRQVVRRWMKQRPKWCLTDCSSWHSPLIDLRLTNES